MSKYLFSTNHKANQIEKLTFRYQLWKGIPYQTINGVQYTWEYVANSIQSWIWENTTVLRVRSLSAVFDQY